VSLLQAKTTTKTNKRARERKFYEASGIIRTKRTGSLWQTEGNSTRFICLKALTNGDLAKPKTPSICFLGSPLSSKQAGCKHILLFDQGKHFKKNMSTDRNDFKSLPMDEAKAGDNEAQNSFGNSEVLLSNAKELPVWSYQVSVKDIYICVWNMYLIQVQIHRKNIFLKFENCPKLLATFPRCDRAQGCRDGASQR
jgi:hypothetical protein